MKNTILAFLTSLVCLLLIDGPWLAIMGQRFYKVRLRHLMSDSPQWLVAAAFYVLYALGITVLVVLPTLKSGGSPAHAFWLGAFLGLVTYGTYDLTNQATLRDWPPSVTVVDLVWGTLLTGVVSAIARWSA